MKLKSFFASAAFLLAAPAYAAPQSSCEECTNCTSCQCQHSCEDGCQSCTECESSHCE